MPSMKLLVETLLSSIF